MTSYALLAAAAAVLVWPDRQAQRRRWLTGRRGRPLRSPAGEDLPLPVVAAGIAAALGATVSTALVAVLAAVVAAVGARAWRDRRRADQLGVRLAALTDGLGALAAELRSGRPLTTATDAAVAACGDAATGRALARAVRAPGTAAPAGARPDDGVPREVLDRLSAAVRLSTRTGCSLAGVLGAVEDDLRARRRHRDELRAATAAPGASALVLAGLPVLGLGMGAGVGADPWGVLTTTPSGQVMLVLGVTLEMVGLAWSRRLVGAALP